jgi:ribosomal protein S24E
MYPDRESVERLEEDFGQDQAQLAARGLVNREHLAGAEPEPSHHRHHHADEETLQEEGEQD